MKIQNTALCALTLISCAASLNAGLASRLPLLAKRSAPYIASSVVIGTTFQHSKEDVLATGHPLGIALFAAALKHQQAHPKPLNNDELLIFPSQEALSKCLRKSPLLSSPWLHEKGFVQETAREFSDKELYPLGVDLGIALMVEDHFVNKPYPNMPTTTWDLIHHNLSTAAKSCAAPQNPAN